MHGPAHLQSATSAPTGVRRQLAEAGSQLRQLRDMHRAYLQVKQHMPGRRDQQRVKTDLTAEVSAPTPRGQEPHRRESSTEHLIARGEDASPHSLLLSQMTRAGLALGTVSPFRKAKRQAMGCSAPLSLHSSMHATVEKEVSMVTEAASLLRASVWRESLTADMRDSTRAVIRESRAVIVSCTQAAGTVRGVMQRQ